jgi:hypothetical protein
MRIPTWRKVAAIIGVLAWIVTAVWTVYDWLVNGESPFDRLILFLGWLFR